ncbi:MAG TPA: alpha-2-macroglobulin family protein, partial [Flavisolibacter sp.]|nr:alpha-2-macroglobulin family protein [Flavisolibacter sp.]
DPKSKTLTEPRYLWTKGSEAIEPGERTTVQIGSSAADVFVVHQVEKPNDTGEGAHEFLKLNSEKKSFEFTAKESERGGYGIGYFFIKHNRFYSFQDEIKVPWSNKELDIEFATFREKTLPGSEEKWTVKIRGYKGEKLAAEMLAGMYDASLDEFKPHAWAVPGIWPLYGRLFNWQSGQNFTPVQSEHKWDNYNGYKQIDKVYDELLFRSSNGFNYARGAAAGRLSEATVTNASVQRQMAAPEAANDMALKAEELNMSDSSTGSIRKETKELPDNNIHIRKNFNETAFFFPELKTDKEGNITFSFTAPEALTRWKLQTLAHTKELAFGLGQKELVTQKELMVQPNAPRFLRQGDRMEFSAKIVNLSGKEMTGQAEFQLLDAATNQPVDGWFLNSFPNQYFTVAAGASEVVKFPMEVPYQFTSALVWRVIARAGNFSDGEETSVPVLTNKLLVTETLPLPMRGTGTKNFTFEKLVKSSSPTLLHHALTFEYTSNPAWFAVQALPYLMETTNESAEAAWNRYYANALAQKIVASSPRIKQIFATWKTFDTAALISNLQKNQELKSALLHETPWVLQAKTETEQKKNIALLFDLVRMTSELKSSLETLKGAQSSNGGFVWMKGAPDDRYMTQYIITGLGRLRKLKAVPEEHAAQLSTIETKAVR